MSFFFTIVCILLIMVRPQEFIEAIKGWPLMDIAAGLSLVFAFLENRLTAFNLNRSATNKIVAIFWIWTAITQMANGWLGGGWYYFMRFAELGVVYYLVVINVDTLPRIKFFLWIVILSTLSLAMQAIIQFYTGEGLAGAEALNRGEVMQARGIGIFSDPNDLALAIVIWVPFLLPFVHRGLLSRTMWSGILVLIPVLTGLVFTRSRGGILGLGAVFWFYFYRRVGLVVSVVPLVLLFAVFMSIPRMNQIDAKEASARARLDHWSAGMDMFKQSPVVGVGRGNFTDHHYRTAHNSFILVLAETGAVGAILWIMMFFSAARDLWFASRDPRAPPEIEALITGVTGALLGWQVCAFFLSHSFKYEGYLLVALCVSVLRAMDNMGIYVDNPFTMKHASWCAAFTMVFTVGFYFMVRVLWGFAR